MPRLGEAENEKHSEDNCGSHTLKEAFLLENTGAVCKMFRPFRRRIQKINATTANPIVNMTEIPYLSFSALGVVLACTTYGPGFRIASSASAMTR